MILPCNTFIIVLSDSTLDMSIILSGSPFVFDIPWKYILPFNFGISWQFC